MDTPVKTQEIDTPPKYLKVVRIPIHGSTLYLEDVPLVEVGPGGISKDECKDFEKKLGHIPDMRSYNGSKHFSWAHRSLVGTSAKSVPKDWDEDLNTTWKRDYMMYLCVEAGAGLPRNEYLNKALLDDGASGARMIRKNPIVYGDAFVFKKEPNLQGPEVFERAEYTQIDRDFVDSAKGGFRAKGILQELLTGFTEGDFDYL